MSRSSRKFHQRKTRKILGIPFSMAPWIIGGLAVAAVALIVIGQAGGSGIDPNFTPKVTGAPGLEVAQAFYDLGDQHFNVPVKVAYSLQNIGDQPLRILQVPKVQVLEGC